MDEMNNNYTPEQQPQYQQPAQPQYQQPAQPQYQYQQAPANAVRPMPADAPTAKTILILGIVGLALSWSPIGSIAAIIISAIGLSKSNAYVRAGGVRCGMSVTGRILSRVGLIVGIVMTVFWAIYFIVIIVAVSSYHSYSGSYYSYYY